MGVDLPEVMTELNQESGRPAFCQIFQNERSAPAQERDSKLNEFLENAQNRGKMKRDAKIQTSTNFTSISVSSRKGKV